MRKARKNSKTYFINTELGKWKISYGNDSDKNTKSKLRLETPLAKKNNLLRYRLKFTHNGSVPLYSFVIKNVTWKNIPSYRKCHCYMEKENLKNGTGTKKIKRQAKCFHAGN